MTLIDPLNQIPDFRHRRDRHQPLRLLLWLSLFGLRCSDGGEPVGRWLPSASTFRRTLQAVAPQGWVDGFKAWAQGTSPRLESRLLSIDGKSMRGTSTGGNTSAPNFVSLVSASEQDVGVTRRQ